MRFNSRVLYYIEKNIYFKTVKEVYGSSTILVKPSEKSEG